MGLLDFLKSNKTKVSKTGFYTINGKDLTPLDKLPKTGSYSDIAESLGAKTFHGIITFESSKIEYIAFNRRTKVPIFIELKDETQVLSYSDVTKIIKEIDWGFEWKQLDFEDGK